MSNHSPEVDDYIVKSEAWRAELTKMREILLDCGLQETIKWNKPCYMLDGANLIATARLKDHCWLMFFRGALLKDGAQILEKAGENSQSMRVISFTDVDQITSRADILRAYVEETISNEKKGLKVDFKESKSLVFPDELVDAFDADPDFKAAFDALTPGRQRGYNLHFTGAKQSATRSARIAKVMPRIFEGKGLTDR